MLGSLLASALYKLFKMLEYETANPGQDEDDERRVADPDDSPDRINHPREHGVGVGPGENQV